MTVVTLTTDFGVRDPYVAEMKGVMLGLAPDVRLVDISHDVDSHDVVGAALVLEAAIPFFPPGTVHLAVVDPGVGTRRRALAARAHGHWFVGPDNGLLEWAFTDPQAQVHELSDAAWFRQPVSRTFHGRDVFAPVAGHLAKGVALERFGARITDPVRLPRRAPKPEDGELPGCVMWIDHFGNALTDLTAAAIARAFPGVAQEKLLVEVGSRRLHGLSRSYGERPVGEVVAIIGSSGRLEIAQVGGDVSVRLGIGEGDPVRVRAG